MVTTTIKDFTFAPIDSKYALHPATSSTTKQQTAESTAGSFKQALAAQLQQEAEGVVKLSKHAKDRMAERHITVTRREWQQIHQKMDEASKMGIADSLVITHRAAFVVNAPQNTVVTAMNLSDARAHIFTNIQGTIVL